MKKSEQGSVSTTSRQAAMGRTAAILVAGDDKTISGRELLARTIATTAAMEQRCA